MKPLSTLIVILLLSACSLAPASMGPVPGGMLLEGAGERIDHVDVMVETTQTRLMVATSWRKGEQHVVFMDPLAKVIAEASWYGEQWRFSGLAKKELPMHAIINLISWTRGSSSAVKRQVEALGGTYQESPEARLIRFTQPQQRIDIRYTDEDSVTVQASIGSTKTVLSIRQL